MMICEVKNVLILQKNFNARLVTDNMKEGYNYGDMV